MDGLENGYALQRRILTELFKFKNLPYKNATNPNAGLNSLIKSKQLAIENELLVEEEKKNIKQRKDIAIQKTNIIAVKAEKLKELRYLYYKGLNTDKRQEAGYILGKILDCLFPLLGLEYKKPYRTVTQQIDGHFGFKGFNYLVEAK